MIRRIFLLCILALPTIAAAATGSELRAVQLHNATVSPQLTLDLSKTTTYRLFTLRKPYRVVLDLRDSRLARGARIAAAAGVVRAIRTGRRAHGTLRVVIELDSRLAASAHWAGAGGARAHLVVDLGTRRSSAVRAPPKAVVVLHAPSNTNRDVIIAVDAGHGGQDPGAIGHDGTREKDVVLAIARALAKRINAEPGMRAVLTRDRDVFLTLRERIARARAAKADLFVSVHADSIRNRDITGASVYVLSDRGATDEAARWLAERENAADLKGGVSLGDKDKTLASVLLDLSQTASISASMTAAQLVLKALDKVGEVRKPRVQQAGFVVLKSPDIPSMLVETAYISNPGEERRLRTARVQVKLADAIFSGLRGYFERNPPPGTRFANMEHPGLPAVLAGTGSP